MNNTSRIDKLAQELHQELRVLHADMQIFDEQAYKNVHILRSVLTSVSFIEKIHVLSEAIENNCTRLLLEENNEQYY